ncbi:hypothetical protein LPY66_18315 [Dehalobacter sp. DCM]|uniref:hypothetical protein n=1 Tax=Dehalobacter sp. DCM TaxID=2907827 RepID=UPI003081C8A6|nr:hypothetical protein LPY66_18315 [Dehalobacter sp. DCM]
MIRTKITIILSDDTEISRTEVKEKFVSCPRKPDQFFEGCPGWNDGNGSGQCCTCKFPKWEVAN